MERSMRIDRTDLIEALRDNVEFWKIVFPVLLAIVVAFLAIVEFAFSDHPIVFIGWSITCLIAGGLLHRWWFTPTRQEHNSNPSEW